MATQIAKSKSPTASKRPRRWHSFGPNTAIKPIRPLVVKRKSSEKLDEELPEVTIRVSNLNTTAPVQHITVKTDHILVPAEDSGSKGDATANPAHVVVRVPEPSNEQSDDEKENAQEKPKSPEQPRRRRLSLVASVPPKLKAQPTTPDSPTDDKPAPVPVVGEPVQVQVSSKPKLAKNLRLARRANSLARPPTRTARRSFRGLSVDELNEAKIAFQKYDTDMDGKINRDDFFAWVHDVMAARRKRLGKRLLKRLADMHWSHATKGGSTMIGFDEFLRVYSYLILDFV